MGLPKRIDVSNQGPLSKEQANGGPPSSQLPRTRALAPGWHTGILVGLILAVFVTGSLLAAGRQVPPRSPSLLLGAYLPMLVVQWGLVLYVTRIGLRHGALRDLLGAPRKGHWASDSALAGLAFVVILGGELLAQACLGNAGHAAQQALLPRSRPEYVVWVVVAVSVGFCEELVYRGYLLRQLSAFTGSLAGGCLLSAALFGLAHAEQGAGVALRFGFYALLLGALAVWRRSLVAGILAHIAVDLSAAFSQLRIG